MYTINVPGAIKTAMSGLIALLIVAFSTVSVASAQNAVNKIEVKDGKVFVNGEMVKELDDADLPLIFNGNTDGTTSEFIWNSDDDAQGNVFVFKSDDGTVSSSGSAFVVDGELNKTFVVDGKPNKTLDFFGDKSFNQLHTNNNSAEHVYNMARGNLRHIAPSPFGMNLYGVTAETDEIRQLERKSYEIARSMRSASADEQEDLQSKLKELLGKIFDLKIENTNERLDKMNAELNKLTEKVSDRRMSRDDIIMRRYNELIGESDSLAW